MYYLPQDATDIGGMLKKLVKKPLPEKDFPRVKIIYTIRQTCKNLHQSSSGNIDSLNINKTSTQQNPTIHIVTSAHLYVIPKLPHIEYVGFHLYEYVEEPYSLFIVELLYHFV